MSNNIVPHANAIVTMIEQARKNALKSVNAELIKLYLSVGKYLSNESAKASWGDSFIEATSNYIKENFPEIKGFTRRGLYRMKQFYETYKENEFVSPLVTQISWTINFKKVIKQPSPSSKDATSPEVRGQSKLKSKL